MDKIDRLKQLLLTHRTEDISKLTFEERIDFDDAFAQEIVKLFAIPDVVGRSEQLHFCKYVKRFGESCTLNNNCKYPNCE
jgi:hypothetical protein